MSDRIERICTELSHTGRVDLATQLQTEIPMIKAKSFTEGATASAEKISKLQAELDQRQWVSCDERLPEEDGTYAVVLDFRFEAAENTPFRSESRWVDGWTDCTPEAVTYWHKDGLLPLPDTGARS